MQIKKIHIDSFMGKRDFALEFSAGINILRGNNESGKSTVAEFIKFMLYGAAARGEGGTLPERQRYLTFGDTAFGGSMELTTAAGHFRIDRTVTAGANGFRESLAVTDLDKRAQVFKGENAGEALLGLPASVFEKVAYLSQEGEGYTGGSDLASSIENLLFSADETVSTDKALKKLDALRVSLRHKNGKGGLLSDIEKEREELEARLARALSDNSEIIAKEGSLLDTERRIADNKTEYKGARKLCELYDNYVAHTRFAKLDAARKEREEARTEKEHLTAALDGFAPDGEYLGRLRGMAEQVREASDAVATARINKTSTEKARAAAETSVIEDTDAALLEKQAKRAAKSEGGIRTLRILAILCFIAAVGIACVVYLMRFDAILYLAALGAGALGAILLAVSFLQKKKVTDLLSTHGVSSAYALLDKAKEQTEISVRTKDALLAAREGESAAAALLAREEERLARLEEGFRKEAEKMKKDGTDTGALFAAVESYIAEERALSEKESLLSDRIAELEHATAAYDREAVQQLLSAIEDLSVFEKLDITEYSRKRDFCENAIVALEIKRGELEKSLAALHATVESPARIKATLDELAKKESEAKTRYAAAELAIRAIENASQGLRRRVSPRLAEYAGKLLSVLTDGKYSELGIDGALAMTYLAEGGAHDAAFLSKGTRESAYFALRLALADLLCKDEKVPLIMDESFAHTDDIRLKQAIRILTALAAEGQQSLILTCHTREERIADGVGVYNLVTL